MKKIFLSLLCVAVAVGAQAQARKSLLIEHFTQASCPPCAAQNPAFEANILDNNEGAVCHISYHTSWPGVDPMNAMNVPDVAERVTYYDVTGVPEAHVLGNKWSGGPAGISQALVNDLSSETSPIRVGVSESTMGSTRTATIDVKTEQALGTGSYTLHAAVVERTVTYASAPGSNGEKRFVNVFRDFLTAANGTAFTAAAVGASNVSTFTYTVPATWDLDSVYVIAWVQNNTTKEVINCGSTISPKYELINTSVQTAGLGNATSATNFTANFSNLGTTSGNFRVYVTTSDMPADWSRTLTYGTATVADSIDISSASASTTPISLAIQPSNTPGVAIIYIRIKNLDDPSLADQINSYYVIANVKELIMSNANGLGDGSGGSADNFSNVYVTALQAAGSTCYAKGSSIATTKLGQANALTNVKAIYCNIGWTFPSFNDALVAELTEFVSNPTRCIFISGQDVCWDVFDPTQGNGTPAQQTFMKEIMKVNYVNDGVTTNNQLSPNPTADPITTGLTTMPINNYYGGSFFFPDELGVEAGGAAIFNYNGGTKIAGVRSVDVTNYRTVYIAPGIEMFSQPNADMLLKNVHNFFFADGESACGAVTNAINETPAMPVATNIPNPCDASTSITIDDNLSSGWALQVSDAMGRNIYISKVNAGEKHTINTANWSNGIYVYQLLNDKQKSTAKRIQVMH